MHVCNWIAMPFVEYNLVRYTDTERVSNTRNNSKYTQEFRDQTAKHIIDSGKSATSIAEEMGIDTNAVYR